MATNSLKKLHLFEAFGIEIEYALISKDSGKIAPLVDKFFFQETGEYLNEYNNGEITWSNELVNHVVELKVSEPVPTLMDIHKLFSQNIVNINKKLKALNCRLCPTAAHPLMNPKTETRLWPHTYADIYQAYHRIFDCHKHGWANLQSVHINLPFNGDAEFSRLHAAIRLVLPLIPALAASSPILEGVITGYKDTRMREYLKNQKKIPLITGHLIPEPVFTETEYFNNILNPISALISPYDQDNIMEKHFLNSRGAIARFDRGAIEIRVMDSQESPFMDLAIVEFICVLIKNLVTEKYLPLPLQQLFSATQLLQIFLAVIKNGENTLIEDKEFLTAFNINSGSILAKDLLAHLFLEIKTNLSPDAREGIEYILANGTLATRILNKVGIAPKESAIKKLCFDLCDYLDSNSIF